MDNLTVIKEHWPKILNKIKEEGDLTGISYSTWIEPLQILSCDNEGVYFIVENGLMAINILNKRYNQKAGIDISCDRVIGIVFSWEPV